MFTKKIKALGLAGAILAGYSSASLAGLYIYPVSDVNNVRGGGGATGEHNTSYHSSSRSEYRTADTYDYTNSEGHDFYKSSQNSSRSADMTVNTSQSANSVKLPCYGRQVPIPIALKEILGDEYNVNYSDGISTARVSWSGSPADCTSRDAIVNLIAESNGYYSHINKEEMTVGFSTSQNEAYHYSYKIPKVWNSDPTLSVTENLTKWAEAEGWRVQWPSIISEVDFESAGTTLFGELIGPGNLFHKVLKQIASKNNDVVLSVKFYKNKHIVVEEGGYLVNSRGNK